jgi:hypothetical protein
MGGATPAFTLAEAQEQLAAWKAASLVVATGQEYQIDVSGTRRKVTRVDAAEIRRQINHWAHIVNQKQRPRCRFAIPTDL